jgi:hypothetical protein
MSHDQRVSLTNLKKPLVGSPQPAVPPQAEAALLHSGATAPAVVPYDSTPEQYNPTVLPNPSLSPQLGPHTRLIPRNSRPRIITFPYTVRIPLDLHERLKAVATHNNLSMTDIVIEALEQHLPNFPQPK